MSEVTSNTRLTAVRILTSVVKDGKSLGDLLRVAQESMDTRDAALLQELTFGVSRWSYRLDALLKPLQKKPLRNKDTDVKILLWTALYEILYMRTPDYAAVDSYAGLTKKIRKQWARGFLNATLREFLRQQQNLIEKIDADSASCHSLPGWIHQSIKSDWPEQAESIYQASNKRAPLVLRVNQCQISRDNYQSVLEKAGISSHPGALGEHSLVLESHPRVTDLPGFSEGHFSVQDSSAQLAAGLVDPQPAERILDACAAPGGKTGHLLELQRDITLVAIDNEAHRLARVEENLTRLQLAADCRCADAGDLEKWWDEMPFDAVLLDSPCSALGVLRRHPDIRLLRRESDIKTLAKQQLQLLSALWQTLKPGGRLIYATCSVLKQENEQTIGKFLGSMEDAQEKIIDADWGVKGEYGRQILPGQYDSDGFYYAILVKNQA